MFRYCIISQDGIDFMLNGMYYYYFFKFKTTQKSSLPFFDKVYVNNMSFLAFTKYSKLIGINTKKILDKTPKVCYTY